MSSTVKNSEIEAPTPGIYEFEESYYHSIPLISKTGLDQINKSPQHYLAWKNRPQEPTDAMIFGSAFHHAVLQPKIYKNLYASLPEKIDKRTKIGKEIWAEFQHANQGKILLDKEQMDAIERMTEEVYSHPTASKLLSGGEPEKSLIFDVEKFGVRMKGRVDYLKGNLITDLKTCEDASPQGFQRSVANWRYYVQAGVYSLALQSLKKSDLESMVFIAIEKKEPFSIGIYLLDDFFVDAGKVALEKNLETYAECVKSNKWPGYDVNPFTLSAPRWLGND